MAMTMIVQSSSRRFTMSHNDKLDTRRRQLLGAGAAAAVAVPVTLFLGRGAQAGDMPKLSEDDGAAKALAYVHDASKTTNAARTDGAICGNCNLYQGGDAEWGGCSVFPGKSVAKAGWCVAWVGRP
jgi:hypothetical protein